MNEALRMASNLMPAELSLVELESQSEGDLFGLSGAGRVGGGGGVPVEPGAVSGPISAPRLPPKGSATAILR